MESTVVRFPNGGASHPGETQKTGDAGAEVTEDIGAFQDREPAAAWPLDSRIAWPRMSGRAVERALGLRPRTCPERLEFERGRKDRLEGLPASTGGSISYRRGYGWQGPRRRRGRRLRAVEVAA